MLWTEILTWSSSCFWKLLFICVFCFHCFVSTEWMLGFHIYNVYTCASTPDSAFMNFASRLRAVLAAARFCDTLAEEGLEGRSGVATGTVWCGTDLSLMRDEGMIVRCLQMMMLTCYCRIGIWKYFLKLEASWIWSDAACFLTRKLWRDIIVNIV